MNNVCDIQIVELAVRNSNSRTQAPFLNGLARCITDYLRPGVQWTQVKERGVALFSPSQGGSYEIFEQRPLHPALVEYSAQDVALLAALEANLMLRFGRFAANRFSWGYRIQVASEQRLLEAQSPFYDEDGRHRALAPVI
jgi:exonuclease 3'-5' domain-containing protein 1